MPTVSQPQSGWHAGCAKHPLLEVWLVALPAQAAPDPLLLGALADALALQVRLQVAQHIPRVEQRWVEALHGGPQEDEGVAGVVDL